MKVTPESTWVFVSKIMFVPEDQNSVQHTVFFYKYTYAYMLAHCFLCSVPILPWFRRTTIIYFTKKKVWHPLVTVHLFKFALCESCWYNSTCVSMCACIAVSKRETRICCFYFLSSAADIRPDKHLSVAFLWSSLLERKKKKKKTVHR